MIFYHLPFYPESRVIKMILHEKSVEFESVEKKLNNKVSPNRVPNNRVIKNQAMSNKASSTNRDEEILALNPAGTLPIIVDDGLAISSMYAITEYLEERYKKIELITGTEFEKAEIRRVFSWVCNKFAREVFFYIAGEKLYKYIDNAGTPDSSKIRAGRKNLETHIEYFEYLLSRNRYIIGENFSIADVAASCYISILDYLGVIEWKECTLLKDWYCVIKSRPSFRDFLTESVKGIHAPYYYTDLDF